MTQDVAVLDRPERVGPRGGDRLPGGHLERAHRGRLRLHRRTRATPREPDEVVITFETGVPVAIDGEKVTMLQAIEVLNERAGAQGVGRLDMVEDRLVGIKSREIYESARRDGADHRAHRTATRHGRARAARGSSAASTSAGASWSTTACGSAPLQAGRWTAFIDERQRARSAARSGWSCTAGKATVTGRRSDASLYDFGLATYDYGDTFDQSLAHGFIELWGLPSRLAYATRQPHPWLRAAPGRAVCGAAGSRAARRSDGRVEQVDPLRLGARALRRRSRAGRTPRPCCGPGCWTRPRTRP